MFLDAVILILQEILEAAMLLSMLLAVNRLLSAQHGIASLTKQSWYVTAMLTGLLGALLFAWAMPAISEWFDDVGQEVTNALMQVFVIACLYWHCLSLPAQLRGSRRAQLIGGVTLVVVVAAGVTREGSEIFLYLSGIASDPNALTPVLLGTAVATGIGISCGILLYYGVLNLAATVALRTGFVLLALFAGNMAAQAVLLLTQADWLPYSPQGWDSSALIQEYSVPGQLLYALVGYEATPSLLQLLAYTSAVLLIISTPVFRQSWKRKQ